MKTDTQRMNVKHCDDPWTFHQERRARDKNKVNGFISSWTPSCMRENIKYFHFPLQSAGTVQVCQKDVIQGQFQCPFKRYHIFERVPT